MNLYEKQIDKELNQWYREIKKDAGFLQRSSDQLQKQTQKMVPAKIQNTITSVMETLTEAIMNGSGLLTVRADTSGMSLAERDYLVLRSFRTYRNTATVQGAGFGMGGLLLGMADLPVLMSIKLKFMFDAAKLYGYDPECLEERLYLLHIFQLAFSGKEHQLQIFKILEDWQNADYYGINWEKLQIEYRDYLDFAKLLQLLPVVGSVAGGTANFRLMNRLRDTVMNCYRMRILERRFPE